MDRMFAFLEKLATALFGGESPAPGAGPRVSERPPTAAAPATGSTTPATPGAHGDLFGRFADGEGVPETKSAAAEMEERLAKPASADEKTELAVEARAGLDGQLQALPGLDADARTGVHERVAGLQGEELSEEMRVIEHAIASPNADRALSAMVDVYEVAGGSEQARARLTPEVVEALVRGVADSRSDSERGQEGVLGGRSARAAARALATMGEEQYAAMVKTLNRAGTDDAGAAIEGADAWAERALLLKALGAREKQAQGADTGGAAMDQISTFADSIRGTERSELIRTTTLLDVQDANTSTVNPANLAANNDTTGDNDGLFQRFEDSCGPTSGQILHGEIDPIFAHAVHQEGIGNADPSSDHAQEQARILSAGGGVPVSRMGIQAQRSLTGQMDAAAKAGQLAADQRNAVTRMISGQNLTPEQQAAADKGLEAVRAANDGHPTPEEVAAMQGDSGKTSTGMSIGDAVRAGSPINYANNNPASGPTETDLGAIDQRLKDGEDVGLRIGYRFGGGHGMAITDARTDRDGNRAYLVADPYSGSSRWVSAAELQSGEFVKTFGLNAAKATHYYTEDPAP